MHIQQLKRNKKCGRLDDIYLWLQVPQKAAALEGHLWTPRWVVKSGEIVLIIAVNWLVYRAPQYIVKNGSLL